MKEPFPVVRKNRWPQAHLALTVLGDLALINLCFVAVSFIKFDTVFPEYGGMAPDYHRFHIILNLAFLTANLVCGSYRDSCRAPLGYQTATTLKACVWASLFCGAVVFLYHHWGFSRFFIGFVLASISAFLPLYRSLLFRLNMSLLKRGIGVKRCVLVGQPKAIYPVLVRLKMSSFLGYSVEGLATEDWQADGLGDYGLPVLMGMEEMRKLVREKNVDQILVLSDRVGEREHKDLTRLGREEGVTVRLLPTPSLIPDLRTRIHDLFGFNLVSPAPPSFAGYSPGLKRYFDLVFSMFALMLLSPLFAFIAAAIKLDSRGPVFFRQQRLGQLGGPFRMFKFRSMKENAEEELEKLNGRNEVNGPIFKMKNDPRVTRVGRILRKFSLDELPQLINVFLGDLSMVGPRPPLPSEVARYEDWQKKRLLMPQGLTGLWQVSGRSRLTFEEMVMTDLYYVENWSFLLDLEILMETAPTILFCDGAY